MNDFQKTLQKYWGYSKFRELQEEIVSSAYEGNDTMALLPTGGGKSICFQVPAMMRLGLALVVTPLIALMKDQVENLNSRNIKAVMINSGMTPLEIETTLDNCAFNPEIKFLYLSPERLGTDLFLAKLQKIRVNFIVVDEAHCISQWGYDFRPSYLKIVDVRQHLPNIPVIALTATATPEVVDDIQNQLGFKMKNVFKKSFERKNIVYAVRITDNKLDKLLEICRKIQGTAIVYVRNRRRTVEIAAFLRTQGISADFYHAGLDIDTRSKKQEDWKQNRTRIVVSTNAFGMGIDKPDVRFVVHIDLPDNLEAYFQEAGRGGRDEKKAWGVLLVDEADNDNLMAQVDVTFPPLEEIQRVYHALGNFLQIPIGGGKDVQQAFNISVFCQQYKFNILTTYNALKLLEKENFITLTDEINNPSKVMILSSKMDLYNFQVKYKEYDVFIKFLLRKYSGILSNYSRIDEQSISNALNVPILNVKKMLLELKQYDILDYIPQLKSPLIIWTEERVSDKSILFKEENYKKRKEMYIKRIESVIQYTYSNTKCRSALLRSYFGEENPERCGQCDVCNQRNELGLSKYEFDLINEKIKTILKANPTSLKSLVTMLDFSEEKMIKVIQWLLEHEKIVYNRENCLLWASKK